MIRTHGLSHIALAVADPDRSLQFYRAVFGVREYFRDDTTVLATTLVARSPESICDSR